MSLHLWTLLTTRQVLRLYKQKCNVFMKKPMQPFCMWRGCHRNRRIRQNVILIIICHHQWSENKASSLYNWTCHLTTVIKKNVCECLHDKCVSCSQRDLEGVSCWLCHWKWVSVFRVSFAHLQTITKSRLRFYPSQRSLLTVNEFFITGLKQFVSMNSVLWSSLFLVCFFVLTQ